MDNPSIMKTVVRAYDVITKKGAFNTSDVDTFKINLKNDFTFHSNCIGIYVYAESPDNRVAYNSANSCSFSSLPETITYKLMLDGETLMDHSHSTNNLIDRRRYLNDVQRNQWSCPLNEVALTSGNGLNRFLIPMTYIDLVNIRQDQNQDEALAGVPSDINLELQVFCGSTGIDADNTNMYFSLVYLVTIDRTTPRVPKRLIDDLSQIFPPLAKLR